MKHQELVDFLIAYCCLYLIFMFGSFLVRIFSGIKINQTLKRHKLIKNHQNVLVLDYENYNTKTALLFEFYLSFFLLFYNYK